jgi:hypothetical protein
LGDGGGEDGDGDMWDPGEDVKVERRGPPEGAPSAREYLRAATVLCWEEGDDGAEDGVGEVADEIGIGRWCRRCSDLLHGWRVHMESGHRSPPSPALGNGVGGREPR